MDKVYVCHNIDIAKVRLHSVTPVLIYWAYGTADGILSTNNGDYCDLKRNAYATTLYVTQQVRILYYNVLTRAG